MKNATKLYLIECDIHKSNARDFSELIEQIDIFENKLKINRDEIKISCFDKNGMKIHFMIANQHAIKRFSMCVIENYDFAIVTYDDDELFVRKHICYNDYQIHDACIIYRDSFDYETRFLYVEKYQNNRMISKQNVKFENRNVVYEIINTHTM